MPTKLIPAKCPSCGANLEFPEDHDDIGECGHCGAKVIIAEQTIIQQHFDSPPPDSEFEKLKRNRQLLEKEILEDDRTIKSLTDDIVQLNQLKATLAIRFTKRSSAAYIVLGAILIGFGLWLLTWDFPENVICWFNILGPVILFGLGGFFIVVFGIVLYKIDDLNEADEKRREQTENLIKAKTGEVGKTKAALEEKKAKLKELEMRAS